MKKYLCLVITLFFVCGFNAGSQENPNEETEKGAAQTIGELKTRIEGIMERTNIPGAAVAIVSTDSIDWIGTFGYADLEAKEPVTEDTHFCIGSCTKSFTGLGFLKLLDQGRIDLNTPVRDIAPEIQIDNPWTNTDPVRIVHLLEHSSGFEDSHLNWFYFEKPIVSLKQALEAKAHLRKVRWRPGTCFSYSSPGFTLAGYVLEKLSGQDYEDYMKQNILMPIGMKTAAIGSSDESRRLLAVGYGKDAEPFPTWYDYDEPAGALNASIKEMALFIQFMLNRGSVDGEPIISEELFSKIGKPESTLAAGAGLESGCSFGIGTRYRTRAKWYGHGGAVPGFLAEYAYNLDNGIGYVVVQNLFDTSFYEDIFSEVKDYMDSQVEPVAPPPEASLSESRIKSLCGYYAPRNPRMRLSEFGEILSGGVTILHKDGKLYRKFFMDTPQPYIPVSENLFMRPDDPEATAVFTENPDGNRVLTTQSFYYEKAPKWKVVVYRIFVFGGIIIMMSAIVYSLFWVPVYLYKLLRRKKSRPMYVRMRVIPLFAVLSLVLGMVIFMASGPSMLEIGQKTPANVVLFLSTLVFAGLSALSLYTFFRSFSKPVKKLDRIYTLVLSLACFGMTLYLTYWGVIGLRLWAY